MMQFARIVAKPVKSRSSQHPEDQFTAKSAFQNINHQDDLDDKNEVPNLRKQELQDIFRSQITGKKSQLHCKIREAGLSRKKVEWMDV